MVEALDVIVPFFGAGGIALIGKYWAPHLAGIMRARYDFKLTLKMLELAQDGRPIDDPSVARNARIPSE